MPWDRVNPHRGIGLKKKPFLNVRLSFPMGWCHVLNHPHISYILLITHICTRIHAHSFGTWSVEHLQSASAWHCAWSTTHTHSIEQHAGHASSALMHNQVSLIIVGGYLPGGVVNEKWFSKQVAYCQWQPAEPCDLMFRGIRVQRR